jgi:hypothetical protein
VGCRQLCFAVCLMNPVSVSLNGLMLLDDVPWLLHAN